VLVELLNAETGQRGFLLTADEKYLEHYFPVRSAPRRIGNTELKSSPIGRAVVSYTGNCSPAFMYLPAGTPARHQLMTNRF
jgi:hypothetical protein